MVRIKNCCNALMLIFSIFSIQLDTNQAKRTRNHNQSIFTDEKNSLKHPILSEVTSISEAELQKEYWYANAETYLSQKLQVNKNHKPARNIILFMGDGMSLPTIAATRQFVKDAAHRLSFEHFLNFGLTKTYCVDSQVTDSAASATAYLTGVKGNYGTLGVNAQVPRYDCQLGQRVEYQTESIAKWSQAAGKWTGFVTNARVTHASPAGLYAHVANRRWEHDGRIERDNCSSAEILDIARQLVELPVGQNFRVILGGGRSMFLDQHMKDEDGKRGKRTDRRDLIQAWINQKSHLNANAEYVWKREDLIAMNLSRVDYLLGLFSASHMPYQSELRSHRLAETVPTLSEMTKAAIELLKRQKDGYFLFVEGAKIDMAHHDTRARRSLEETAEFANAVKEALSMTSESDTLIVVIADHAHTMTIGGYPQRGANVLGLNKELASDELPYTILSYANGPGYTKTYSKNGRKDLTNKEFADPKKKYMATVPLDSETHGGEDTGVFANGPQAEIFSGNYELSYLPILMAKAAKIGPFQHKMTGI